MGPGRKRIRPAVRDLLILMGAYGGLRLLFFSMPKLKFHFFIFPVGKLISFFLSTGAVSGHEWIFSKGDATVVLSELCSGTTFFALLAAYILMRRCSHGLSAWWFIACYPVSLLANTARVLCSIYVYAYAIGRFSAQLYEQIHLFIGVVVFLVTFLSVTLLWDRQRIKGESRGA